MIKANELRIGNYIREIDLSNFHTVVNIESFPEAIIYIDNGKPLDEKDAMPIELTPEILQKAGFELKSTLLDYCKGNVSIRQKQNGYEVAWYHSTIHYLHQLQNLYFALTNEELTITL